MKKNFQIDAIIRFHDLSYIDPLKDALLSLASQRNVDVKIYIPCQNFNEKEIQNLKLELKDYEKLFVKSFEIFSVLADAMDIRAVLLNESIKKCESQYLAILDCDDVLYPDAYEYLANRLYEQNAAISFGAIVWCDSEIINGHTYITKKNYSRIGGTKFDLFVDNFCPIHSFLIDRNKIEKSDLYFSETMTVLEDYHFLLRIVSKYESTFVGTNHFIGEYRRRSNDSIRESAKDFDTGVTKLEVAREAIKNLKTTLQHSTSIVEYTKLAGHWGVRVPSVDVGGIGIRLDDFMNIRNENNQRSTVLSSMYYFMQQGIEIFSGLGGIDAIVEDVKTSTIRISGWLSLDENTPFNGLILYLGKNGHIYTTYCNVDRPDVENSGGVLTSGFELFVKSDNEYIVMAISNTGHFMRIRIQS